MKTPDYLMTEVLSGQMAIDEAFAKIESIRIDYRDKEAVESRRQALDALEKFGTIYLHRKAVAR